MLNNRNLPLLLAQARECVISHFRPILNHFGLTEQQWRVLRVLCEKKAMEPRDICETCQILSPSMAGILKRLEEMNLIKRDPVKGDKRRVMISLTPTSETLFEQISPLVQQQYQYLEQAWGEEMMAKLYQAVDTLLNVKEIEVRRVKLPEK